MSVKAELADYAKEDEHIVRRLGWGVVKQWHRFPEQAKAQIAAQAGLVEDDYQTVQLSEQIAAFLRKHTPDA